MTSNRHDHGAGAGAGPAVMELPYVRRDQRRRDIVDHSIMIQHRANTICAVEYLKSNGIDARVIERVLLEPDRRSARNRG
jgi:hypothetical protein